MATLCKPEPDSRKDTVSVTSLLQKPQTARKRDSRLDQYLEPNAEDLEDAFEEEVSAPLLRNNSTVGGVEMTTVRNNEALPLAVPVTKDISADFSILCPRVDPSAPVAPPSLYPYIPELAEPPPSYESVVCMKGSTTSGMSSSGATKPATTTSVPIAEEDLIINQPNEQQRGYKIRDYACDEYKSDYGKGGYQISTYKSIYD